MKLKYFLLLIFTFGLTACPTPDGVSFKVNDFKVEIVEAESGTLLKEDESIKWDRFAIRLNFETEELLASNFVHLGNAVFATHHTYPVATPQINNITIHHKNNNGVEMLTTSSFALFSYNEECSADMIWCLNSAASSTFEQNDIRNYLKLKQNFTDDIVGKFHIKLEFEDGSILQDSTQTVTITSK
ncbi:hypothetical protein QUH73_14855 [Labilibaculum sp. K2S]|uniref:hypothetical protein n=1 Tax=Labilibaculum sp. K2S TaxID=3056386 RepID=UPI0025A3F88F|nr:hypothetical protein [Labilibaculum sp. K2S]MDM8161102.1 hypothetical protein [Labilibaculum sp. K2S]